MILLLLLIIIISCGAYNAAQGCAVLRSADINATNTINSSSKSKNNNNSK